MDYVFFINQEVVQLSYSKPNVPYKIEFVKGNRSYFESNGETFHTSIRKIETIRYPVDFLPIEDALDCNSPLFRIKSLIVRQLISIIKMNSSLVFHPKMIFFHRSDLIPVCICVSEKCLDFNTHLMTIAKLIWYLLTGSDNITIIEKGLVSRFESAEMLIVLIDFLIQKSSKKNDGTLLEYISTFFTYPSFLFPYDVVTTLDPMPFRGTFTNDSFISSIILDAFSLCIQGSFPEAKTKISRALGNVNHYLHIVAQNIDNVLEYRLNNNSQSLIKGIDTPNPPYSLMYNSFFSNNNKYEAIINRDINRDEKPTKFIPIFLLKANKKPDIIEKIKDRCDPRSIQIDLQYSEIKQDCPIYINFDNCNYSNYISTNKKIGSLIESNESHLNTNLNGILSPIEKTSLSSLMFYEGGNDNEVLYGLINAAKTGNIASISNLGVFLRKYKCFPREAKELISFAAEKGFPEAMYNLASIYEEEALARCNENEDWKKICNGYKAVVDTLKNIKGRIYRDAVFKYINLVKSHSIKEFENEVNMLIEENSEDLRVKFLKKMFPGPD